MRRRTFHLGLALATLGVPLTRLRAAPLGIDQLRERLAAASAQAPADLSGVELVDLDLSHIDFKRARLVGTSLFASKLVHCNFAGADLTRATLNGAWLMGTDFRGAVLAGASLLSVVVLGGQVKARPNFEGADLSGARVIADFPGVNLRQAKLVRADLGVHIKNQGMGQMRTDLTSADLAGADLSGADLNRSLLSFAQLRGAKAAGANFYLARLDGADFTGADVSGANFAEANLDGAIFTGATGLESAKGL